MCVNMRKNAKDVYSSFKKIILNNKLVTVNDAAYENDFERMYNCYETLFHNNSQLLQIYDLFNKRNLEPRFISKITSNRYLNSDQVCFF